MRGLAAVYVMLFHYLFSPNRLLPSWISWFTGEGWSGVVFFFVLSGYLLATIYTKPTKKYFVRRIFRTFPLYYASLPLYVLAGLIVFSPLYLIYAQNYFPQTFVVTPLWTLTLEELFYFVLFPLILIFNIKPRYLVLGGIASAVLWLFLPYKSYVNLQMPEYFVCYAVGIFLAKNRAEISRRIRPTQRLSLLLVGLFVLTDVVVTIAFGTINKSPMEALVYSGMYGLIIVFMQNSILFTNRISLYLGRISYGLYILQGPFLFILANPTDIISLRPAISSLHLSMLESVPLAALVTFCAATASYYLFESRLIALGRRITR
jgi:exopolysaccharide production protein ExoZ